MFIGIDGIMGSGKTYYAVDYMYKNMQKYYKIYNNINGFQYQYNIFPLSFGWLFGHLRHCHDIFLIQREQDITNDDVIFDYLVENSILGKDRKPVLIVIDEAHNEFSKKDDFLTWVITYSRHYYIDFILITQSYTLINREYFKIFEYFLSATPASRKLSQSTFSYTKYIAPPFNKDTKVGTEYLKARSDVFAFYKSGDKVRVKSFLRKYLLITILIALVTVFAFFQYIQVFFGSSTKKVEVSERLISSSSISNSSKFLSFNCVNNFCIVNDKKIKFSDLIYLVKNSNSKVVRSDIFSDKYAEISILATPLFFSFIERKSDEKNIFNSATDK